MTEALDARVCPQDEVAGWMKEGMKLKEARLEDASRNLLDMSLEDLFHVEPSRRGQRRANLFKQRMAEAEAEEAIRKGKGAQSPIFRDTDAPLPAGPPLKALPRKTGRASTTGAASEGC
jgi:hypothetical protein